MCSLEQPDDRAAVPTQASESAWPEFIPGGLRAGEKCPWCGMNHGKLCPFVKALSWHPNGAIARVEFHDSTAAAVRRDPATGVLVRDAPAAHSG